MNSNLTSNWVVNLGREYVRLTNPVGFIARGFIARVGRLVNVQEISVSKAICIDVGAGTTPYRSEIKHCLGVSEYIALDIAPTNLTDVVGDAARLPFAENCAEYIASFDVIQHLPDPIAVLKEFERVLVPGGCLLLTFPFNYCECDAQDFRRWTLSGMGKDLGLVGLQVVCMEQRGGRFFSFACGANWIAQHLLPGQRQGWRSEKTYWDYVRAGLVLGITIPTTILQWISLGLDRLFPNEGCYMGGMVVARKCRSEFLEQPGGAQR